ncbi:MAG: putative glycosyltransferase, exosortase G system-associated [Eubacterium sp.]|nr:putative glycosyltransferase, exosortase G system-associated [Eubacterium sp.]
MIINRFFHSILFWGAWIIIPVIMEILPALGGGLLLISRRRKQKRKMRKAVKLKNFPGLTLIIPVYNSEETLFNCVRSVAESTYPSDALRIYLVNNQGKDNSFAIYSQCQEAFPQLKMQWLNSKQGKSRALNLALYNSDGKYIINLDSDGQLEPHALEYMVTRFENDTSINCMTGAVLTDPGLIKKYKKFFPRLLRNLEFMEYAQAFLAGRSYASETDKVYTLSGAFSAFRKSAILKSRLYNTNTICEDTQITFQMRYIQKEKVEVCEDAIFFVDPIEDMNKLYTQRQRWQRGSLEVAKQFLDKKKNFGRNFLDVNVHTLLYDHTFAFPRLIWYVALFCLVFMNYSTSLIILSTGVIFLLYILVGFVYFAIVNYYLKEFTEIKSYYQKHWWVVFLLPFFNFLVFFIRFAGVVNSINTDSAWKTRNFTEEKEAFGQVVREDFKKPLKKILEIKKYVNGES